MLSLVRTVNTELEPSMFWAPFQMNSEPLLSRTWLKMAEAGFKKTMRTWKL